MIDFSVFFGELHRDRDGEPLSPYPWQVALAERLAAGDVPSAVVVPTGAGKTATIDALIWALARQAERKPNDRTIGVRTVWAIDRRILVDEVHDRAARIAARLAAAAERRDDALHGIAAALTSYTGGFGPPLTTARWRGQVRIEPRAHHPLQPQVVTSTVAQIGSRLLFRGFGVGERSLAVEAALAAVDSTVCLDEAHLAEPFRQTVDRIRAFRAASEPEGVMGPLSLMTLSATTATTADGVHGLTAADESALARRLDAVKRIELVESENGDARQVDALLQAVLKHVDRDGARRVACVVNTVGMALEVHRRALRLGRELTPVLLVGPQRPYDRQRVLDEHRAAIFDRQVPAQPLLVVATQTIEVGLDADFDALVTQSASATAVVQRLGRLNRAGLGEGNATVVRRHGDPLYEHDEPLCWEWLQSRRDDRGVVDGSPRALVADGGPPADARVRAAPLLTQSTIGLLQQTAPRPAPMADPAVEPFLRGVEEPPGDDVQVCWRADLRLDADDEAGRTYREAVLRLAPPRSHELVTLGIGRLRALLTGGGAARGVIGEPDVEGGGDAPMRDGRDPKRFVVVRDGEVLSAGVRVRDIRPGDVVVLETCAGGYVGGALAPASASEVEDVGNAVVATVGDRLPVAVRLAAELGTDQATLRLAGRLAGATVEDPDDVEQLLGRQAAAVEVRRTGGTTWDPIEDDDEFDVAGGALFDDERAGAGDDAFVVVVAAERRPDLVRSRRTPPPTLEAHAVAVADRAASFAAHLDRSLAAAVTLAARAHDHGKADDRFQAFFRGGAMGVGDAPLAKSLFGVDDRRASRAARRRAGLPSGLRHEIASVAVLADHLERSRPDGDRSLDEDLALHLVGTHHGLGRPWPRMPQAGAPARAFAASFSGISGLAQGDGLDGWGEGAWLSRFTSVTERYGPWGTAYLEALLALADRTVSSEGG